MTPREIDQLVRRLDGIDGRLREHGAQLGRIEGHVRETNGRVKKLEVWRAVQEALASSEEEHEEKRAEARSWLRRTVAQAALAIAPGVVVGVVVAVFT